MCSYAVLRPDKQLLRLKAKKLEDEVKAADQALMRAVAAYLNYRKVHPHALPVLPHNPVS